MPSDNLLYAALAIIFSQLLQLYIQRRNKKSLEAGLTQVKQHVDVAATVAPPETKETNTIVKEMLASLQAGQRGWEIAVQMLTANVAILTDQAAQQKSENDEQRNRLNRYAVELDRSLQANAETGKQVEALKGQLKDMDSSHQEDKRALADTQGDLTRAQAELTTVQAELTTTKGQLDEALRRIEDIERARTSEHTLAETEKQALEDELLKERAKVQALQQQVADQQARIVYLEGEVARLTTELAHKPNAAETSGPPPDVPHAPA